MWQYVNTISNKIVIKYIYVVFIRFRLLVHVMRKKYILSHAHSTCEEKTSSALLPDPRERAFTKSYSQKPCFYLTFIVVFMYLL